MQIGAASLFYSVLSPLENVHLRCDRFAWIQEFRAVGGNTRAFFASHRSLIWIAYIAFAALASPPRFPPAPAPIAAFFMR
jgi:hypothetical protein